MLWECKIDAAYYTAKKYSSHSHAQVAQGAPWFERRNGNGVMHVANVTKNSHALYSTCECQPSREFTSCDSLSLTKSKRENKRS